MSARPFSAQLANRVSAILGHLSAAPRDKPYQTLFAHRNEVSRRRVLAWKVSAFGSVIETEMRTFRGKRSVVAGEQQSLEFVRFFRFSLKPLKFLLLWCRKTHRHAWVTADLLELLHALLVL